MKTTNEVLDHILRTMPKSPTPLVWEAWHLETVAMLDAWKAEVPAPAEVHDAPFIPFVPEEGDDVEAVHTSVKRKHGHK
jgi:hypothetical protein